MFLPSENSIEETLPVWGSIPADFTAKFNYKSTVTSTKEGGTVITLESETEFSEPKGTNKNTRYMWSVVFHHDRDASFGNRNFRKVVE